MTGFLVILDSFPAQTFNMMQNAKQWWKKKKNTQQTWCLSKYAAKSRPPEWSHCSLHWDTIFCFLFIWRATSRMSTGVNLWVKEQEKKKSRQLLLLQEAGSCRHPSSLAYDLRPSSPPPTDQRDFHRARGNGDTDVSGGSESGRKWERVPMRVSCKHGEMDGGRGKRVKPAGSEDGQDKLTKTAEKEPIQASCEPLCQVKYQTRDSWDAAGETKESFVLLFGSHSLKTSQWTQTATFQALNQGMKSQTAENNPKSQTWSEAEKPCQHFSHL